MPSNFDEYFEIDRRGDKLVVRFKEDVLSGRDELDALFRRLDEVVNMTPKPDMVLSFRHVKHVSSMFLGKLLAMHKKVQQRKGQLILTDVNDQVREVLILTRATEYITVEGMEQHAGPLAATSDDGSKGRFIAMIALVIALLAAAAYLLLR